MTDPDDLAVTYDEEPVFFPFGELSLAGVLTTAPESSGRTILLPWGSSTVSSAGVNRVRARIARALAGAGYDSFRFDYPGIGESQGHYVRPEMSSPFTGEVLAACDWLQGAGHDRIVVAGNCFGCWSALQAAPEIPGLEGMFLVNPPVRRDHKQVRAAEEGWQWWAQNMRKVTVKKLLDPTRRAKYRKMVSAKGAAVIGAGGRDTRFPEAVRLVVERGVPLYVLFGDDDFRNDFEAVLERGLQDVFDGAGPATRVKLIPERLDGIIKIEHQDMLIRLIISWLEELPSPQVGAEGDPGRRASAT